MVSRPTILVLCLPGGRYDRFVGPQCTHAIKTRRGDDLSPSEVEIFRSLPDVFVPPPGPDDQQTA